MYCAKCGKNNEKYALYCTNDGFDLQPSSNEISIQQSEAEYCSACGMTMVRHAAYCSKCGEETGSHTDVQISSFALLRPVSVDSHRLAYSKLGLNFKAYLKKGVLGGLTALVTLLILCTIINITLHKQLPELMGEDNPYIELLDHYQVDSDFTIFGVPETAMTVNLIPSSLHATGDDDLLERQEINIRLGLITLLAVPLAALVFAGYLSARFFRFSNQQESFLVSIVIGLYYGVGMLIISRMAGFTKIVGLEQYSYGQSPKLIFSFSWLAAIITGWLLGTCFSWIGYKLYNLIHTDKKWLFKDSAAAHAIRAVATTLAVLSIMTLVIAAIKLGDTFPFSALLLLAPQIALYLFNFAHLVTIHFGGAGEQLHYSLISGLGSASENSLYTDSYLTPDFLNSYVYGGLFVTLVILIWVGYRYVKNIRKSTIIWKYVGFFSITYGGLMALLAKLSSIGFTMTGGGQAEDSWFDSTFFISFNAGYTFLAGFLISLLLLIGSFLSQKLN